MKHFSPHCLVLQLGLLWTVPAAVGTAQQVSPFSCADISAEAPLLRAGSKSELVGVITLNCSGGTPSVGPVPTTFFDVYLDAPYSGRITQSAGAWTESFLTLDDPASPALAGLSQI